MQKEPPSERCHRHSGRDRPVLATQAGGITRAVLEAVAIEAYRSSAITPRKSSRCSGWALNGRQRRFSGAPRHSTITRWMTSNGISQQFVTPTGDDSRRGCVADHRHQRVKGCEISEASSVISLDHSSVTH